VAKLLQIVNAQVHGAGTRVLVFANYRETADDLVDRLRELDGVRPARFVGHAKASAGKGLTKKEQQRVVDDFRHGRTNVLVATSVGEEGLDLPDCDAVVLFEPVASGIRMIQRRGRTGRHRDGRFFVLMTEGTRDAAYYWSARRREQRMNTELRSMRRLPSARVEAALPSPADAAPKPSAPSVVVDTREFQSPVVRRLVDDGFRVKAVQMETGDYLIGDHVLVERKTAKDLAASIVDGRFFDQVERLGRSGRGVMLVEGSLDRAGSLSRNALAGAVASAFLDHGVSLVFVPDGQTSSDVLAAMARRSARLHGAERSSRVEKAPTDPAGLVSHLIQGLPGIGPSLAGRLAATFGSLAAVCDAPVEALAAVDGIGSKRAAEIHHAVRTQAVASRVDPVASEGLALKAGDGAAG
jgi:Fanconi anemia group M protein